MQIVPAKSVGRSYRRNHHYGKTHPPHLARPFSILNLKTSAQPNPFVHAAIGSEDVVSLHWRKCKRAKFSEGDFSPISAGETMGQAPNLPFQTTLMAFECAEDGLAGHPVPLA
jgi:hypothetical protein